MLMELEQPPKPHRWLRFSLRTLLLFTAVVACWVGWVVNSVERQRKAVAAIENLKGEVIYTRTASDGYGFTKFLASLIGRDYVDSVRVVTIHHPKVTNDDLAVLTELPSVKSVFLDNLAITNCGLRHLRNLEQLRSVSLTNLKVTNEGLQNLLHVRNLQTLYVYRCAVTADGISKFHEQRPNVFIIWDTDGSRREWPYVP